MGGGGEATRLCLAKAWATFSASETRKELNPPEVQVVCDDTGDPKEIWVLV
jgi:hypothetical protein